jgi:hypothetical protein
VRIAGNSVRRPREIAAIVELVAAELDAEVVVSATGERVEISPRLR